MTGTGVKTNGVGKRTVAHLNRSTTLADVWGQDTAVGPPLTQKAAILEQYHQRVEPRAIARKLGVPVNTVTARIAEHRKKTGGSIKPEHKMPKTPSIPPEDGIWGMSEEVRREAFARRAAAAAKEAREAAAQ